MKKFNYPRSHVRRVFFRCLDLRVYAPTSFARAKIWQLQAAYNGVGPDRWPHWLRRVVTWLLQRYEIAALPHDWEYCYSPKTYWSFTVANYRFALNATLEALEVGDLAMIPRGIVFALVCQLFGWRGYKTGGPIDGLKNQQQVCSGGKEK